MWWGGQPRVQLHWLGRPGGSESSQAGDVMRSQDVMIVIAQVGQCTYNTDSSRIWVVALGSGTGS